MTAKKKKERKKYTAPNSHACGMLFVAPKTGFSLSFYAT